MCGIVTKDLQTEAEKAKLRIDLADNLTQTSLVLVQQLIDQSSSTEDSSTPTKEIVEKPPAMSVNGLNRTEPFRETPILEDDDSSESEKESQDEKTANRKRVSIDFNGPRESLPKLREDCPIWKTK